MKTEVAYSHFVLTLFGFFLTNALWSSSLDKSEKYLMSGFLVLIIFGISFVILFGKKSWLQ